MSPEDFRSWGEALRDLGGWGVSLVFLVIIIALFRENRNKDNRIFGYLEKNNETLTTIASLKKPPEPPTPGVQP